MSNDFLREYHIPTLKNDGETHTINAEEVETQEEEEMRGISNISRYIPPGRPDAVILPSRKRPHTFEPVKQPPSPDANAKFPIFLGRDPSYPDELNALINPLFCELCNVQLNSKKTATCHYESKSHDRKLTNWLNEHYPDNPPPVKRFVHSGPAGPQVLHCDICDLPLNSLAHAKQHYDGRRHQSVAAKKSDPSGAGYYNAEGKWVRTGTKKYSTLNDNGRFGIGMDFVVQSTEAAATETSPENGDQEMVEVVSSPKPATTKPIDESQFCGICKVAVTSASQMETHLKGAKHKKKLAASGGVPPEPPNSSVNSLLQTLDINEESIPFDLSMYRTPTGSYYCQICNTNMNAVTVLQQHLQGKKHKLKAKVNDANKKGPQMAQ